MENLSCDVLAWGYKVSCKLKDDGDVGSHCCKHVYSRQVLQGTLVELLCGSCITFLMCSFENAAQLFFLYASGINKAGKEAIFVTFDLRTQPFSFKTRLNVIYIVVWVACML